MPTYDFICKKCSYEFEEIMKISDPLPTVCPKCQVDGGVQKKIMAAAFHLKGGGWYTDAYSNKKSSAGDKGEGGKIDSTPSTGGKTDSTPAVGSTPEKAASSEKSSADATPSAKPAEKKSSSPVSE